MSGRISDLLYGRWRPNRSAQSSDADSEGKGTAAVRGFEDRLATPGRLDRLLTHAETMVPGMGDQDVVDLDKMRMPIPTTRAARTRPTL